MNPRQLDLFERAENRPSAEIHSAVPGIAQRIWRELYQPRKWIEGEVIPFRRMVGRTQYPDVGQRGESATAENSPMKGAETQKRKLSGPQSTRHGASAFA